MILSHAKIEEIAAAVTKDFNLFFFGQESNEGKRMPQVTPIDQFAREYLHLSVSFENLSTDGSFCGLTAYEDTEYYNGSPKCDHFPKNYREHGRIENNEQ